MQKDRSDLRSTIYYLSIVSQLGLTVVVCIGGGLLAGMWIGDLLGGRRIGALVGLLFGLAAGGWTGYRMLVRFL